ncbi:MAG: YdcF family protein [Pseudomonadota bacterium]|nr:YdcF family protein [Pseudomonadota bacterium]
MKVLLDPAVLVTFSLFLMSLKINSKKLKITVALMALTLFLPISEILISNLENKHPLPLVLPRAEAAVVFGGGFLGFNQRTNQYVYGSAFERFGEAVRLVQEHKIKYLIFTGVTPNLHAGYLSEADSVYRLAREWGLRPEQIKLDHNAVNTFENGKAVKKILEELGVTEFLLVTSASHMTRSFQVLKRLGLNPYAYPVDYQVGDRDFWNPNGFGLNKWLLLKTYLHEVVGFLYYKCRDYI